jgi:immune inhibitor A
VRSTIWRIRVPTHMSTDRPRSGEGEAASQLVSRRISNRVLAIRVIAALILVGSFALGAGRVASTGMSTSKSDTKLSAGALLARLVAMPVPARNLYLLTDELKLRPPRPIARVLRATSPNYAVGHQDSFQVLSEDTNQYFSVQATIHAETPHFYLYIQNGLNVKAADAQKTAATFEHSIYPTDRSFFGSEWTPGVDGDPHVVCLVADLRSSGVAGYFSSEDEYLRVVNPYSNQREMIYLNAAATLPGDGDFNLTLSHEFQHMIHFHMHPHDNAWLNEGMSMLAERLNHYAPTGEPSSYVSQPDTQLNSWSESDSRTSAHYGGAYLFLSYLYDRFGRGFIKDLVADKKYTDFELINDVLQKHHISQTSNQIFGQWVVANVVHDHSIQGGIYGYKSLPYKIDVQKQLPIPTTYSNHVPPYAPQYVMFDSLQGQKPFQLHFSGSTSDPLVSAPNAAPFWWSNKGDLSDMRTTRTVDLRRVHRATLRYRLWYDIEKDYDYGYVEASTDGGKTWSTLPGQHSTRTNPNGANFGFAYTGSSHGWHDESIDLSRFAGRQIELRLEYVTDDVYTGQGMVVKNISIPEIGFHDTQTGWKVEGFIPVTMNALPSTWVVQVISYTNHGVTVQPLPLPDNHTGSLLIDPAKSGISKIVVVMFNEAPKTTVETGYRLEATSP